MFGVVSVPYLLVYFHRVAPAVVMDRLMDEFKGSGAVLGNLAAIYFYIYTLMQIPSGILADSWGPRRTITMGCVVSAGGSVLFGLAHSLPMAYAARFLVGLGVSVIFIPILKIITLSVRRDFISCGLGLSQILARRETCSGFFPPSAFCHGFFRLGLYSHLGHWERSQSPPACRQRHGFYKYGRFSRRGHHAAAVRAYSGSKMAGPNP